MRNRIGAQYLAVAVLTLASVACKSDLGRPEAAAIIQAELARTMSVKEIRVFGDALVVLMQKGIVVLGPNPGGGVRFVEKLHLASAQDPIFSAVRGGWHNGLRPNCQELRLTLRQPLQPTDVQVTGIAQDDQSATVEFSYAYHPVKLIAELPENEQQSPCASATSFVHDETGQHLSVARREVWRLRKFDDGWRVVR